jgi:hypothetical protein
MRRSLVKRQTRPVFWPVARGLRSRPFGVFAARVPASPDAAIPLVVAALVTIPLVITANARRRGVLATTAVGHRLGTPAQAGMQSGTARHSQLAPASVGTCLRPKSAPRRRASTFTPHNPIQPDHAEAASACTAHVGPHCSAAARHNPAAPHLSPRFQPVPHPADGNRLVWSFGRTRK